MSAIGEHIFHGLILSFLLIGIWDVTLNYEENKCEMTYMWEMPTYKQIHLGENVSMLYPDYSLYVYAEGEHRIRELEKNKFKGVPVLFIPGHGGSHEQARSLGSVLLRKAISSSTTFHFDVFTVDLAGELTAIYGATLESQTKFVYVCIEKILSLYENDPKPNSVAIVGHSMGGVIARGLFTIPQFNHDLVKTIILLATPAIAPVLNADHYIAQRYTQINQYWNNNINTLKKVTIVSIGGGTRDFQVATGLTRLSSNLSNHLFTTTNAVPRVSLSTDHLCIVWCKQLVLSTARYLFDIVDSKTQQITDDVEYRVRALKFHFESNPGGKVSKMNKPRKFKPSAAYTWKLVTETLWTSNKKKAAAGTYFVFHISHFTSQFAFHLVARSVSIREKWVIGCKHAENDQCTEAVDLSYLSTLATNYRIINIDLRTLEEQGFTHVIFPESELKAGKVLDVNILSDHDISAEIIVPHIFSNLWTFGSGSKHPVAVYEEKQRFYYKCVFKEFKSIYQVFKVGFPDGTMLKTEVPQDKGQSVFSDSTVVLKLRSTLYEVEDDVTIHIYLPDSRSLDVQIKVQFFEVLGQLVRYFGTMLPVFVLCNIMLTYYYQVGQINLDKPCHSLRDAHNLSSKPYKVQPFISLLKFCFGYEWFKLLWYSMGLPKPDSIILDENYKLWFSFLPLILFLFAFEIFSVTMMLQTFTIKMFSKLLNLFSYTESIFKHQVFHSLALAFLLQTHSAFSLLYIVLMCFINLCISYNLVVEDKLTKHPSLQKKENTFSSVNEPVVEPPAAETSTTKPETTDQKSIATVVPNNEPPPTTPLEDQFSVNFVLLQLYLWMLLFTLPSFAVYIATYRTAAGFPYDPWKLHASVGSSLFLLILHRPTYSGIATSRLKPITKFLFPCIVLMAIVSMHSLYRAPWFILIFIGFHTVSQYI